MASGHAGRMLSQLLRGVTGVAAWFVGSMFTNLRLLKFSWVGRVAPGRKHFFTEEGSSADVASNGRRYALHPVLIRPPGLSCSDAKNPAPVVGFLYLSAIFLPTADSLSAGRLFWAKDLGAILLLPRARAVTTQSQ